MRFMHPLNAPLVIAASLLLTCCAGLRDAGKYSAAKLSNFSLANLLPGPGVKVVKVRDKDLQELPTGRERALAYETSHKSGLWFFGGPVDFKEPTLPEPGAELDGTLLPAKAP